MSQKNSEEKLTNEYYQYPGYEVISWPGVTSVEIEYTANLFAEDVKKAIIYAGKTEIRRLNLELDKLEYLNYKDEKHVKEHAAKLSETTASDVKTTVVLEEVGANKVNAIKAVREITKFELKEAKDLVESVPAIVIKSVSPAAAIAAKDILENAGTKITLYPVDKSEGMICKYSPEISKLKSQITAFEAALSSLIKDINRILLKADKANTPETVVPGVAEKIDVLADQLERDHNILFLDIEEAISIAMESLEIKPSIDIHCYGDTEETIIYSGIDTSELDLGLEY